MEYYFITVQEISTGIFYNISFSLECGIKPRDFINEIWKQASYCPLFDEYYHTGMFQKQKEVVIKQNFTIISIYSKQF